VYFKVPVLNGLLDLDYEFLQEGVQINENEFIVLLREGFETREYWQPLTEREYLQKKDEVGALKRRLQIIGQTSIPVNTSVTYMVEVYNWENLLISDSKPLIIKIIGPNQPAELILTPVNGQAEFDFESPISGTFTIRAEAAFLCDPAEMEVIVHE